MAGALTISTLKDSSGVLATQNGMTGICKAWVLYNGVAQTVTGSFNVSSITYRSTGQYTLNFTTAMPNANYSAVGTASISSSNTNAGGMSTFMTNTTTPAAGTTTSFDFIVYHTANAALGNGAYNSLAVFSS